MKEKEENIKTKIFFSYSHSEKADEYLNEIEKILKNELRGSLYDRLNLEHKGEIFDLIGNEKEIHYFIFIMNESFFKSDKCMFALNELARAKETRNRCFPIITKDADIFNDEKINYYIDFWDEEIENFSRKIETNKEFEDKFLFEINKCSINKITLKYLFNYLKDVNTLKEDEEEKIKDVIKTLKLSLKTKIEIDSEAHK